MSTSQPSLADVPDFEKQVAQQLKLVPGDVPTDVAHATTGLFGGNKIYVDQPDAMTPGILAHEVLHQVQNRRRTPLDVLLDRKAFKSDPNPDDPDYYYGGAAGLKEDATKGQTIANLTDEQQGAVIQNYVDRRNALEAKAKGGKLTQDDLEELDALNDAYRPFIHQMANMARTKPGIDTNVQPPGPPPAALTGMSVPLPDVGGDTIYATHPQTGHRLMTKDGGKSWQEAQ